MRASILAAALPLLAACATVPPLRPADPAQAVANERSAATAAAAGVRIVVRPGAWKGFSGDLEEYFTPVEVAIQNGSGQRLQVRPSSFTLLAPNGFRYDALSTEEIRRALGPFRGHVSAGYGYSFYGAYPWRGTFYPWGAPYAGTWGWSYAPSPWWGPVPYSGSGAPAGALAKGTLDPGGSASVVILFPVAFTSLRALELQVDLADTSGRSVAAMRVPFVREGERPAPAPLPPAAAPAPEAPASPVPPAAPGDWQNEPPPAPPR